MQAIRSKTSQMYPLRFQWRFHHHTTACLLLLAVCLIASAFTQPAAAADVFDKSRCTAWIKQYESWHKANRGAPGAKYLIADAPGFVGVGDHLRGYMYALRVAAGTDRVLLMRWEHPGNLTDFLVPGSDINWQWDGTPAMDLLTSDRNLKLNDEHKDIFGNNDLGRVFGSQFFTSDPSNKTFLVLKTNFPADQTCVMCPGVLGKAEGHDAVCMFRYLFKPSAMLQQKTDQYLAELYPGFTSSSSTFEFQAVHLRLGSMHGEQSVINRARNLVDPLSKLLLAVSCGRALATQSGLNVTQTPVLLLADHQGVRRFSRHGKLTHVVTPEYDAVHTKVNSVEAHLLSFVDLNLMARSKCLVMSHSGFSNVAWWLSGGNSCKMTMTECFNECSASKDGPFCP